MESRSIIETFRHQISKGSLGLQERVTISYYLLISTYSWDTLDIKFLVNKLDWPVVSSPIARASRTLRLGLLGLLYHDAGCIYLAWMRTVNNERKAQRLRIRILRKKRQSPDELTGLEIWYASGLFNSLHGSSEGSEEFDPSFNTVFIGLWAMERKIHQYNFPSQTQCGYYQRCPTAMLDSEAVNVIRSRSHWDCRYALMSSEKGDAFLSFGWTVCSVWELFSVGTDVEEGGIPLARDFFKYNKI